MGKLGLPVVGWHASRAAEAWMEGSCNMRPGGMGKRSLPVESSGAMGPVVSRPGTRSSPTIPTPGGMGPDVHRDLPVGSPSPPEPVQDARSSSTIPTHRPAIRSDSVIDPTPTSSARISVTAPHGSPPCGKAASRAARPVGANRRVHPACLARRRRYSSSRSRRRPTPDGMGKPDLPVGSPGGIGKPLL